MIVKHAQGWWQGHGTESFSCGSRDHPLPVGDVVYDASFLPMEKWVRLFKMFSNGRGCCVDEDGLIDVLMLNDVKKV